MAENTTSTDSMRMSAPSVNDDVIPVALLSGIVWPTVIVPELADTSAPTLVQVFARFTAAAASTTPKPYLWLTHFPAPFWLQPGSVGSFFRAVLARMCCTSRQPRVGLASSMSATTPETSGVEDDVPPKSLV